MNKVGGAGIKLARSRGDVVSKDFAAAVKDIKLAILQLRAHAMRTSNVDAFQLPKIRHSPSDELAICKWRNAIPRNSTIANGRKPHRFLASVIEGIRRELANGLGKRTKKKGRQ